MKNYRATLLCAALALFCTISPYNTNASDQPNIETLFWRQGGKTALRHGDWKLLQMGGKLTPGKAKWELYDLSKDLSEEDNLAADKPDRLAELIEIWEKMNSEMSEPLF
jgi:arylsulfatase A-like enzyme